MNGLDDAVRDAVSRLDAVKQTTAQLQPRNKGHIFEPRLAPFVQVRHPRPGRTANTIL
jgi:hypothetical protein